MSKRWGWLLAASALGCGGGATGGDGGFATGDGGFATIEVVVSGRVIDAKTDRPVAGASVIMIPGGPMSTTNGDGLYSVSASLFGGQPYRLRVTAPRYAPALAPVPMDARGPVSIDLRLSPVDAELLLLTREIDLGALGTRASFALTDLGGRETTLEYSISTDAPWLSASPTSGTITDARAVIDLAADRRLLGERWGRHEARVLITSNGGNAELRVRLEHLDPADRQLAITSTTIRYGLVDVDRVLRIENLGRTTLSWELSRVPGFISPVARAGEVRAQDFVLVGLRADRRPVAAGRHVARLLVSTDANAGPRTATVSVVLDVADVGVPAIDLTELDFGRAETRRSFTLHNRGKGRLDFSIASALVGEAGARCGRPASGVRIEGLSGPPFAGSLPPDGSMPLTVTVGRDFMRPRQYVAPLTVRGGGQERVLYAAFRVEPIEEVFVAPSAPLVPGEYTFRVDQPVCLAIDPVWGRDPCAPVSNVPVTYSVRARVPWLVPRASSQSNGPRLSYLNEDFIRFEEYPEPPMCFDVDRPALGDRAGELVAPIEVFTSRSSDEVYASVIIPEIVSSTVATAASGLPAPLPILSAAFDPFRDRAVLYGGANPQNAAERLTWELTPDGRASRFATASGPTPTARALIFDLATGRTLAFAPGTSAMLTWAWDGATWSLLATQNEPPPREEAALAYDHRRGRVLLYGGTHRGAERNDLWALEGTAWTRLDDELLASPRTRARMVYEASGDRLLIDGGRLPVPSPRAFHGLVRHAARNLSVLFGGLGPNGALGDTWTYAGERWTELRATPSPSARVGRGLAYDARRERVILFGGCATGEVCAASDLLGDTWAFDGARWTQLSPPTSPPPRTGHALAYDSLRDRVVLFGGLGAQGNLQDTWELDGTTWAQVTTAGPPARRFAGMSFDPVRGQVVLFGGTGAVDLGDTWLYDGARWTAHSATPAPPARSTAWLDWNRDRERVVLFSGSDVIGDHWEWTGTEWIAQSARINFIRPRRGGAFIGYEDTASWYIYHGTMIFGGAERGGGFLADQWAIGDCTNTAQNRCSQRQIQLDRARDLDQTWRVELSTLTATVVHQGHSVFAPVALGHAPRTGHSFRGTATLGPGGWSTFRLLEARTTLSGEDEIVYDWNRDRLLYVGFARPLADLRVNQLVMDRRPRTPPDPSWDRDRLNLGFAARGDLRIENAGEQAAIVRIESDQPWLVPSPPVADVPGLGLRSIGLLAVRPGLPSGTHRARLTLFARGVSDVVDVSMEVQ